MIWVECSVLTAQWSLWRRPRQASTTKWHTTFDQMWNGKDVKQNEEKKHQQVEHFLKNREKKWVFFRRSIYYSVICVRLLCLLLRCIQPHVQFTNSSNLLDVENNNKSKNKSQNNWRMINYREVFRFYRLLSLSLSRCLPHSCFRSCTRWHIDQL